MLSGKNIVVTGARGGIGRSIVEKCAKNGANVWACTRTRSDEFESFASDLSATYGVTCEIIYFDIADPDGRKEAIKRIRQAKRSIDGLVNNAGMISDPASFFMLSESELRRVMDVNFISPALFTQGIARVMAKQNSGSIVNISSIAAMDGTPAQFDYASSKGAIIGGTKELAAELGAQGIRVNAVAPGVTQTSMGSQVGDDLMEEIFARSAIRRLAQPEEIADAVAFLLSDQSAFITGQVLRVDGGAR